uniref:Uncharacterized protein n=1 Tax=Moniliophthora roreri TaxID=221103 RepID=A0A0W0F5E0_MONRR
MAAPDFCKGVLKHRSAGKGLEAGTRICGQTNTEKRVYALVDIASFSGHHVAPMSCPTDFFARHWFTNVKD